MSIYKVGRPTKYTPATNKGTPPPNRPGEYRITTPDRGIVYVGETNNLNRRMREHANKGKLSNCPNGSFEYKTADGRSTSVTRRKHERDKIEKHKPALNNSSGGEGRKASR